MSRKTSSLTGLLLIGMLTLLLTISCVNAQTSGWSRTYGGPYGDKAYALTKTQDGGYALAGTTNSFGSGIINAWLVKTNAEGEMQWNQTYSGLEQGIVDSMVQTADGGYALAGYSYAIDEGGIYVWLIKTDSDGNLLWNNTYTDLGTAIAYGIIQTADGGYALVGASNTVGEGGNDGWLIKVDSDGALEWYQTYGAAQNDALYSIVQAADGGYVLGGESDSYGSGANNLWLIKTDSSGMAQWNQTYGDSNNFISGTLIKTQDGGYAIVGTVQVSGSDEFVLVKTDSSGNMQWNQTYRGINFSDALFGIQTSDGGYALTGVTDAIEPAYAKGWLVKTDSNGIAQWNQTYGGPAQNVLGSIVQNSDGTYVLAGYTNSTGAGAEDFWLIKTDATGVIPEFSGLFVLSMLVVSGVLVAVLVRKKSLPKN
ncbi:MAG: hypothetical protein NWF00_00425 [Candidatus Bathyarchaeota archaeon]|nr:hypothetical protein [Candidatus Bathyarchaeota archaeon]